MAGEEKYLAAFVVVGGLTLTMVSSVVFQAARTASEKAASDAALVAALQESNAGARAFNADLAQNLGSMQANNRALNNLHSLRENMRRAAQAEAEAAPPVKKSKMKKHRPKAKPPKAGKRTPAP